MAYRVKAEEERKFTPTRRAVSFASPIRTWQEGLLIGATLACHRCHCDYCRRSAQHYSDDSLLKFQYFGRDAPAVRASLSFPLRFTAANNFVDMIASDMSRYADTLFRVLMYLLLDSRIITAFIIALH